LKYTPATTTTEERMRTTWLLCGAAALMATGCKASVVETTFKPVTVKAKAPEPAPAPEPEPVPVAGEKIEISEMIHFHTNSARLKRRSYQVLDEVIGVMNDNPELEVEIQGHTDSIGRESRNRRLSERRAIRVQEYFVSRGIDSHRLTAVGYGEEQPIADNTTREGRYQNRRVDFVVTGARPADTDRTEVAQRDER
jgi:outer membrane protein OmpA-like peptidoglycan-associated protein